MAGLQPKPGFDWGRVAWGLPESERSCICSYCCAGISDDDVPLLLCKNDGSVAQFCSDCQATWWGVVQFAEPDEDDDYL